MKNSYAFESEGEANVFHLFTRIWVFPSQAGELNKFSQQSDRSKQQMHLSFYLIIHNPPSILLFFSSSSAFLIKD